MTTCDISSRFFQSVENIGATVKRKYLGLEQLIIIVKSTRDNQKYI